MTRALIADDEPHLAHYLRDQCSQLWPDLQVVAIARNGVEAAAQIAELQPDIAFLDIQMPGLTGLEVAAGHRGPDARRLRDRLRRVRAARLRARGARLRAQAGHRRAPRAHRRTPAPRARAPRDRRSRRRDRAGDDDAAWRARCARCSAPPPPAAAPLRWIRASQGELTHQVDVADVLYFHADDKYTCVRTAQAEYLIRTPIAELAAQLDGSSSGRSTARPS